MSAVWRVKMCAPAGPCVLIRGVENSFGETLIYSAVRIKFYKIISLL